MITFIIGLIILIAGAAFYGSVVEKIMKPDSSAKTPAFTKRDGLDFVPLNKWKSCLVELLNIAGTGPVLGPIQGILFGPIAFLTIPIGCVFGGAVHDYMSGMISLRNNGEQMPDLVRRFLGRNIYLIYHVFVCLLMLLVGAVFIYTPGDLFVAQVLHGSVAELNSTIITVYGVIFAYYLAATLLPIDKIIGRIYPIFGAILLLSAIGIFFGLFIKGYPLTEVWDAGISGVHPFGDKFIPMFFVTVACGIVSGFHSTQATMIARTVTNEKDGKLIYYNTMIAEGFIAMSWAGATMGAMNAGLLTNEMIRKTATVVVGTIATNMLGDIGGTVAVLGVIVLAITSGDTALRSLRLMLTDAFGMDSSKKQNNVALSLALFAVVAGVLYFAKSDAGGFNVLWRYFSWANETIAVFAFTMISVYMMEHKMPYIIAMLPGAFYMHIVTDYILHAPIGFNLDWKFSDLGASLASFIYVVALIRYRRKHFPLNK